MLDGDVRFVRHLEATVYEHTPECDGSRGLGEAACVGVLIKAEGSADLLQVDVADKRFYVSREVLKAALRLKP